MRTSDATRVAPARPFLGLRVQPGRLALAVFRVPLPLYRAGLGWVLGHTFLLLVHAGRRTGRPHTMTAMVLRHDRRTRESVICSAWGPRADWVRNIRAHSALQVRTGGSPSSRSSGSSARRRVSRWRSSSGGSTRAGCA